MGWACLQEELSAEFESLSWSPEETLRRAFQKNKRAFVNTGYRLVSPKPARTRRIPQGERWLKCAECRGDIPRERLSVSGCVKFCCNRCKWKSAHRTWRKNHPEWRKPKKPRPIEEVRFCMQCSKGLPPRENRRGSPRLYCNRKCADKYKYHHREGAREKRNARQRRSYAKAKLQRELDSGRDTNLPQREPDAGLPQDSGEAGAAA